MSRSKTRLYFGKLREDIRERDLEKFVRGYGQVRDISIKKGYGFVEFYDERDAEDVVWELNGRDLLGERVIIEHARDPSSRRDFSYGFRRDRSPDRYRSSRSREHRSRNIPVRTDHRLLVENLSSRVNWQELKEIFNDVSEVTFTDAHKRERNTGIVEFATKDDMKTALKKLQGRDINGKKIKLSVEKVGGSRSRSRSKDRRSRSKSPKRRRHHSRSRSPKRSRSKSASKDDEEKEASKSRSRSKSPEQKSGSQSPEAEAEESNRESEHESGNESPQKNGDEENGNEEEDAE
ncbi:serine/arginine-rich splicing factor 5-like [Dendronephthya gigantea]|uniref:serine/arginine-rich splicing factor 5-like n=1 Tax=Dendronephthya gigantea TaxID=151771 RepID=UPI00106A87D6|nr:serine/arginine-rich splicing factor 5-like [Dendronephthya gigantea]